MPCSFTLLVYSLTLGVSSSGAVSQKSKLRRDSRSPHKVNPSVIFIKYNLLADTLQFFDHRVKHGVVLNAYGQMNRDIFLPIS